MKRDMELVKRILKYVEKNPLPQTGFFADIEIAGFSDETIQYHIRLCADANFVRINQTGHIIELTWAGQDELERLRAETAG